MEREGHLRLQRFRENWEVVESRHAPSRDKRGGSPPGRRRSPPRRRSPAGAGERWQMASGQDDGGRWDMSGGA